MPRLTLLLHAQASPAAQGYAVALAESAQAAGSLDAVHADAETFAAYSVSNAGILSVLGNPVLADSKKKDLIAKMAKEGSFSPLFVSFLNLLVDKRRIVLVDEVLAEFEEIFCSLTDTQARISVASGARHMHAHAKKRRLLARLCAGHATARAHCCAAQCALQTLAAALSCSLHALRGARRAARACAVAQSCARTTLRVCLRVCGCAVTSCYCLHVHTCHSHPSPLLRLPP